MAEQPRNQHHRRRCNRTRHMALHPCRPQPHQQHQKPKGHRRGETCRHDRNHRRFVRLRIEQMVGPAQYPVAQGGLDRRPAGRPREVPLDLLSAEEGPALLAQGRHQPFARAHVVQLIARDSRPARTGTKRRQRRQRGRCGEKHRSGVLSGDVQRHGRPFSLQSRLPATRKKQDRSDFAERPAACFAQIEPKDLCKNKFPFFAFVDGPARMKRRHRDDS